MTYPQSEQQEQDEYLVEQMRALRSKSSQPEMSESESEDDEESMSQIPLLSHLRQQSKERLDRIRLSSQQPSGMQPPTEST
jgi:DNA-binding TFAR19-related protein (PDSD5 family)